MRWHFLKAKKKMLAYLKKRKVREELAFNLCGPKSPES